MNILKVLRTICFGCATCQSLVNQASPRSTYQHFIPFKLLFFFAFDVKDLFCCTHVFIDSPGVILGLRWWWEHWFLITNTRKRKLFVILIANVLEDNVYRLFIFLQTVMSPRLNNVLGCTHWFVCKSERFPSYFRFAIFIFSFMTISLGCRLIYNQLLDFSPKKNTNILLFKSDRWFFYRVESGILATKSRTNSNWKGLALCLRIPFYLHGLQ